MDKQELIGKLKDHDLFMKGSRNNDAVNLCILSTMTYGVPDTLDELLEHNDKAIKRYGLCVYEAMDETYYEMKCEIILEYLDGWDTYGIINYAIG